MAHLIDQLWKDRRLRMGREEVSRKLSFAGNWQTIRIGIRGRICVDQVGVYLVATPVIGVYASSGVGGGWLADRSQAFVGASFHQGLPSVASMSIATSSNNFYAAWNGVTNLRRQDATVANTTASTAVFFSAMPAVRSAFIVNIAKAATTWTYSIYAPSSAANALVDKTYVQFINDMGNTGTPAGYAANAPTQTTISPFNTKILDTVSFAWTNSNIRFELQDIVVVRTL